MNKKLTVNSLALGNLRHRRKQYTIMIIGIIFAMILTGAVPLLFFSAAETRRNNNMNDYGLEDAIVYVPDAGAEFYNEAIKNGFLEGYGFAHLIGYAYPGEGNQMLGAGVAWLDEDAKELSYQSFIEGNYPVSDSDIAIEQNALTRLGYKDAKIGDIITVTFDVQNGSEYLGTIEKQYTLCGIVRDKKNLISRYSGHTIGEYDTCVPALFVREGTETEPGGREKLVAYIDTVPVSIKDEDEYYFGGGNPKTFHSYLMMLDFDEQTGRYRDEFDYTYIDIPTNRFRITSPDELMYGGDMVVLVMLALIFAACVAIVNAFNNDLKGRKKQIGMLRAVGATRRQIFSIFGREALYISLVCAPVSILISYIAVKLALGIVSEDAVMTKSLLILPVCAAVDILVVMGAAMVPLISASRITPVQAIRNISNNRKIRTKHISSKTLFDPAKHIARRDMTFYKGSQITVTVILALTILVSCYGFSSLSFEMDHIYQMDFDYELFGLSDKHLHDYYNVPDGLPGLSETERNEIASDPYISDTTAVKRVSAALKLDDMSDYMFILSADSHSYYEVLGKMSSINKEDYQSIKRKELEYSQTNDYDVKIKEALGADNYIFNIEIASFDRKEVERLARVLPGVDIDKIDSGEDVILIMPDNVKWMIRTFEQGYNSRIFADEVPGSQYSPHIIAEADRDIMPGDKLDVVIADITLNYENEHDTYNIETLRKAEHSLNVAAVTSMRDLVDIGSFFGLVTIVTTHEGMSRLYDGVNYCTLYANGYGDGDEQTDAAVMEMLQHYADKYDGWTNSSYQTRQSQIRRQRKDLLTLLAMIIIGFAVCASIINNALSAKIRENKSVIGTLRAVGASERELVRRYVWQMLSMFSLGAAGGYALFIVIFLWQKIRARHLGVNQFPMYFSPWVSVAMTAVLFLACAANLWLRVREEMKHSIVENIREL